MKEDILIIVKSGRGRVHEYKSLVQVVAGQDQTGIWRYVLQASLGPVALEIVDDKLVSQRCAVEEQILVRVDVEAGGRRLENVAACVDRKDSHLLLEIGTRESGDVACDVHDKDKLIGGADVLDLAGPRALVGVGGLDEPLVERDDLLDVGGHEEGARVHRHAHGSMLERGRRRQDAQMRVVELERRLALARHVQVDEYFAQVRAREAVCGAQHHVVVLRPDDASDGLVVHAQVNVAALVVEGDESTRRRRRRRRRRLHCTAANNAHELG